MEYINNRGDSISNPMGLGNFVIYENCYSRGSRNGNTVPVSITKVFKTSNNFMKTKNWAIKNCKDFFTYHSYGYYDRDQFQFYNMKTLMDFDLGYVFLRPSGVDLNTWPLRRYSIFDKKDEKHKTAELKFESNYFGMICDYVYHRQDTDTWIVYDQTLDMYHSVNMLFENPVLELDENNKVVSKTFNWIKEGF